MLKANELRLGNLVKQGIVESIGSSLIQVSDIIYETEVIKPIELTEDWLIKFGFYKKNGYGFINITMKGGLYNSLNNDCYIYNYYGLQFNCKYVHQLQNLYFALTCNELQVNVA